MPTTHLTDSIVSRLPLPERGSKIYADDAVSGFGCRVTANGAKSFVFRYRVRRNGRNRTYTLGSASILRTTAAREKAKALKRVVYDGGDPAGDLADERAAPTVAEMCERFETEHVAVRLRPSTRADYSRLIRNHVLPHFGEHTKVRDVRFEDIDRLHRKITDTAGPYSGNRVVSVLSKAFNLSIRWEWRESNPCRGIERNAEAKRKRYLDGPELARLTQALAEHSDRQAADIIRLILLTGCRKGEALGAKWADLDLTKGVWSKPGHTTKQKTDHIAPLSAPVRLLLAEIQQAQAQAHPQLPEYVFVGRYGKSHRKSVKRDWEKLLRRGGIVGVRLHDLRHSFASQLVSSGHSLELIGSLLGHSNAATTHRYAHLYDDVRRTAVEKIGVIVENAGRPVEAPIAFKK